MIRVIVAACLVFGLIFAAYEFRDELGVWVDSSMSTGSDYSKNCAGEDSKDRDRDFYRLTGLDDSDMDKLETAHLGCD